MGYLKAEESSLRLEKLKADENIIQIYYKEKYIDIRVKDLAEEALNRIKQD